MAGLGIMDAVVKDGMVPAVRAHALPHTADRGATPPIDDLPGFRRRIRITPKAGHVLAEVEDDYHHMSVEVAHDGGIATMVRADMARVPWTTCPGAPAVVAATFTGVPLDGFVARGAKTANCTHLHDLALLAAAHAGDGYRLIYDILVSDPQGGRVRAELRRNGQAVLGWTMECNRMVAPAEIAQLGLMELGPWIATLDRDGQEAARLLRWGSILSHGRTKSMEARSKATDLPIGQCYTFQPETAAHARYVEGTVLDFSGGAATPLMDGLPGNGDPTGWIPGTNGVAMIDVRGETA